MVAYGRTRNPGKVDPAAFRQSYQERLLEDSPAGLWMLDEVSGTTAADLSGNARHGTYQAGYTLAQSGPGAVATAVALTGEASGTGRITFPAAAVTSLTGDFTLGLLLKMSDPGDANWNLLSVVSGSEWSQSIQVNVGSAAGTTNKLSVRIGSSGWSETSLWSDVGSDLGTGWHHVAVRASGSSPTTYSLFVDGTSIASTTSSVSRANSGNDLHLGRRTATSVQRGRTGSYAGLYLCSSALSDARIADHVAAAGLA